MLLSVYGMFFDKMFSWGINSNNNNNHHQRHTNNVIKFPDVSPVVFRTMLYKTNIFFLFFNKESFFFFWYEKYIFVMDDIKFN